MSGHWQKAFWRNRSPKPLANRQAKSYRKNQYSEHLQSAPALPRPNRRLDSRLNFLAPRLDSAQPPAASKTTRDKQRQRQTRETPVKLLLYHKFTYNKRNKRNKRNKQGQIPQQKKIYIHSSVLNSFQINILFYSPIFFTSLWVIQYSNSY